MPVGWNDIWHSITGTWPFLLGGILVIIIAVMAVCIVMNIKK